MNLIIVEKFIESIREYIESNGITVTEFSRIVGCLERCVARWLNGTNIPSTEYVVKVADSLRYSVDYLFQRTDKKEYIAAVARVPFSDRLKFLIDESGKSKSYWAKVWGVEPSAVTKWMNGTRLPKPDTIYIIADSFGYTMDFVLGRTDY